MITRARVTGRRADVLLAAGIFLVAGVAVAGLAGAALGGIGYLLGMPTRALAAISILIGLSLGALSRLRPLQLDWETPLDWLLLEDWRTAAYNAISLALGFTTRIGFWLFFLVPVGAFITGHALLGALIYATYAAARTVASFVLASATLRSQRFIDTVQRSYEPIRVASDFVFFAGAGYLLGSLAVS